MLADFPTIRVAPVVLLRSPHEIAMSLCSRSLASGGVHAYWDCLDVVGIHYSRLKKILDEWNEPTPFVRFGSPTFLDDLALTARRCGLDWDADKGIGDAGHFLCSSCRRPCPTRLSKYTIPYAANAISLTITPTKLVSTRIHVSANGWFGDVSAALRSPPN